MKFNWCTITVKDMEASLAFYRDIVGLPVSRRFSDRPDSEICFLGDGETQVELICEASRSVRIHTEKEKVSPPIVAGVSR